MLAPEVVQRDQSGFWVHPALEMAKVEIIDELPEAAGMEIRYVEFFFDAPAALQNDYEEGVKAGGWENAVRLWEPTVPKGDGWFLLGVFDSHDGGPTAAFARPAVARGKHLN